MTRKQVPLPTGNTLRRERLLRCLDGPASVTVVRGPAGSGKSTLLTQWATSRSSSYNVVWLEGSGDASEFRSVVDGSHDGPLVVVLDGVQDIDEELVSFLSALPRNARVLLSTRVTTLNITSSKIAPSMREIGPEDINMQDDEFVSAVQQRAPRTPLSTLRQLSTLFHAEAAALAGALLAKNPEMPAPVVRKAILRHVLETRVQRVLSAADRDIVASMSVVDSAAAEVLRAWNPTLPVEPLFARLEAAGLGAQGGPGSQFSLTPIFREALQQSYAFSRPPRLRELARLGSLHSLNSGNPQAALRSALVADDGYLATRVVRQHWKEFFGYADWPALDPLSRSFPELQDRFPILALAHAVWLQSIGDTAIAKPYFQSVADRLDSGNDEDPWELLWTLFAKATALRNIGQLRAAAEAARSGIALLASPTLRARARSMASDFFLAFAEASFCAGDTAALRDAVAFCVEEASDGKREAWAMNAAACAADGDASGAHFALQRAQEWPPTGRFARLSGYLTYASAVVGVATGKQVGSLDNGLENSIVDERTVSAAGAWDALNSGNLRLAIARVDHTIRHATSIDRLAESMQAVRMAASLSLQDPELADETLFLLPRKSLTRASLSSLRLYVDGSTRKAMLKSSTILRADPPPTWERTLSELIFACTATDEGDKDTAADVAQAAWSRMRRTNNLMPFTLLPLSGQVRVGKLIGEVVASPTSLLPVARRSSARLTRREFAVLERLMEYASTSAIAAELHVSTNTVKTQLRGIYRKLCAENRREALLRAAELGLFRLPDFDDGRVQDA